LINASARRRPRNRIMRHCAPPIPQNSLPLPQTDTKVL
jgi:hypothetical protein